MAPSSGKKPDFIIVGAMKCATSTLHDQLNMHDSFFMINPKEPNFFSDNEVYSKGFSWYESLFENSVPGQLKGESSTHYTKLPQYPEAVRRMAAYCSDIKCIYLMRHPVDRLVSHYVHDWTQRVISCDIDKAVFQHPEMIDYGRYNMQIEPYLKAFGFSAVLPMFTERLRDDPQRELQAVFDFLGVHEKPIWHEDIRSNVSAERLRVCAWRDVIVKNNILTMLRRTFVPKKFRRKIRKLWTMKVRPDLSPETLEYVVGLFNKDLELLADKLGLELTCENFKDKVVSQKNIAWAM